DAVDGRPVVARRPAALDLRPVEVDANPTGVRPRDAVEVAPQRRRVLVLDGPARRDAEDVGAEGVSGGRRGRGTAARGGGAPAARRTGRDGRAARRGAGRPGARRGRRAAAAALDGASGACAPSFGAPADTATGR